MTDMMRAFLRSLKINARRGERKLIVFIAAIRRIYLMGADLMVSLRLQSLVVAEINDILLSHLRTDSSQSKMNNTKANSANPGPSTQKLFPKVIRGFCLSDSPAFGLGVTTGIDAD